MDKQIAEQILKNQHVLMHAISQLLPTANPWQLPLQSEAGVTQRLVTLIHARRSEAV